MMRVRMDSRIKSYAFHTTVLEERVSDRQRNGGCTWLGLTDSCRFGSDKTENPKHQRGRTGNKLFSWILHIAVGAGGVKYGEQSNV